MSNSTFTLKDWNIPNIFNKIFCVKMLILKNECNIKKKLFLSKIFFQMISGLYSIMHNFYKKKEDQFFQTHSNAAP